MSEKVNSHPFEGTVIAKSPLIPITGEMKKQVLYCRASYMVSGKPKETDARFIAFSWGDNSKLRDVYPGDEVSFYFGLSGKYDPERKDKNNLVSCFTEAIIQSKVEVIDQSNRKMYDNRVDKRDDLGVFVAKGSYVPPPDDPPNDLPFGWFIPFLLPLAANFIL